MKENLKENKDRPEVSSERLKPRRKNLVLLGMPGSGKSTVGREVALKTGMDFVDADDYLVQKTGKTVDEILQGEPTRQDGWTRFRDTEEAVLRELSLLENTVIAAGGGAVERPNNAGNLLVNGVSVFLSVSISELVRRSEEKKNPHRAAMEVDQETLADYTDRWNRRKGLFEGASDYEIPNEASDPEAVVGQIVSSIKDCKILEK